MRLIILFSFLFLCQLVYSQNEINCIKVLTKSYVVSDFYGISINRNCLDSSIVSLKILNNKDSLIFESTTLTEIERIDLLQVDKSGQRIFKFGTYHYILEFETKDGTLVEYKNQFNFYD